MNDQKLKRKKAKSRARVSLLKKYEGKRIFFKDKDKGIKDKTDPANLKDKVGTGCS
jgi:hypothetical protein